MFHEQITAAIAGAYGLAPLQALSSAIWKGHASGALSDNEAQTLAEQIEARKALSKAMGASPAAPARRRSIFTPRRPQRSPDRLKSITRRRQLASAGPMPPALAAHFTEAERAVMKIVADEHLKFGSSDLSLDEIAARAGCSRTSAQNAMRQARQLGLIIIQIRKRRGQPNETNVIKIIAAEWLSWLDKAPKRATGFKALNRTVIQDSIEGRSKAKSELNRGSYAKLHGSVSPALPRSAIYGG